MIFAYCVALVPWFMVLRLYRGMTSFGPATIFHTSDQGRTGKKVRDQLIARTASIMI